MIHLGERLDDLHYKGRKILQDPNQFCFSTDSVLLAHFPTWKKHFNVLDLGTGNGIIPLLIADHVNHITAVELNPTAADIARRNVLLNGLSHKITIINADLRDHRSFLQQNSFHAVIANPPYFPTNDGLLNPNPTLASARHELNATFDDFVCAARFALRFQGHFFFSHIPARLVEICNILQKHQFALKHLQFYYASNQASFFFAHARLYSNPSSLVVLPPLHHPQ